MPRSPLSSRAGLERRRAKLVEGLQGCCGKIRSSPALTGSKWKLSAGKRRSESIVGDNDGKLREDVSTTSLREPPQIYSRKSPRELFPVLGAVATFRIVTPSVELVAEWTSYVDRARAKSGYLPNNSHGRRRVIST